MNRPEGQTNGLELNTAPIDLAKLLFSAKIDYVKIRTEGKVELPVLIGTPRWSRKEHYKSLTIHDLARCDIAALGAVLGEATILELEVAIDLRPRPALRLSEDEHEELLRAVMVQLYAMGLNPLERSGVAKNFRGAYHQFGPLGAVVPYNRRLPAATSQQLHGLRLEDSQVKAYLKGQDMRKPLPKEDWTARVEARLAGQSLAERDLTTLSDLLGFGYRKRLMPFLTHMRGTTRMTNCRGKLQGKWLEAIRAWQERHDGELWKQAGVGAFLEGGLGDGTRVRLLRDTKMNDRIGQALTRLESAYAAPDSVCFPSHAVALAGKNSNPHANLAFCQVSLV